MRKLKINIVLGFVLALSFALNFAAAATDWNAVINTYKNDYESADDYNSLVVGAAQNVTETVNSSLNFYDANYKNAYEKANEAYTAAVTTAEQLQTSKSDLTALKTKLETSLKDAQKADSGATADQVAQIQAKLNETKALETTAQTELNKMQDLKTQAAEDRQTKGEEAKMKCPVGKVCVELIEPIYVNGETVYTIMADAEGEGAGGGMMMIQKYASILYRYAAGILGFLAVLVIVASGIQIMTSASGGSEAVATAKDRIEHSLMGLVLLFLTALLLYTVNPTFFTLT